MKNKINQFGSKPIFLFLIAGMFLAGPALAVSDSKIKPHQAIVKINTYVLDEYDNLSLWGSGSGIIIDPSGLVLTNYHVTSYEEDFDNSLRETSFQICLTIDPNEEADCSYLGQMVSRDKDLDVAILKITPIEQLASVKAPFPFLKLNEGGGVVAGSKVSVLGYPSIGAETITTTEGIISGKVNKYKKDWLKTDAVISFGNSGGAAVDKDNRVVGLTSEAHSDLLGTLGYLINVSSLTQWIADHSQSNAMVAGFESRLSRLSIKQKELKKDNNTFQNEQPSFSIVKPHDWDFEYNSENKLIVVKKSNESSGAVAISIDSLPVKASVDIGIALLKRAVSQSGMLGLFNISKNTPTAINNLSGSKITISVAGKSKSAYIFPFDNYLMTVDYDYGRSDKDKAVVDGIINSLRSGASVLFGKHTTYQSADPVMSLISNNDWLVSSLNSKTKKAKLLNAQLPNADISLELVKLDTAQKDFTNEEKLKLLQDETDAVNNAGAMLGIKTEIVDSSAHFKLNDEIGDAVMVKTKTTKIGTNELLLMMADHYYKQEDHYIDISFNMLTDKQSDFDAALVEAKPVLASLSLKPLSAQLVPPSPTLPLSQVSAQATTSDKVTSEEPPVVAPVSAPAEVYVPIYKKIFNDFFNRKTIFWALAGVWGLAIITVLFLLFRNLRRQ